MRGAIQRSVIWKSCFFHKGPLFLEACWETYLLKLKLTFSKEGYMLHLFKILSGSLKCVKILEKFLQKWQESSISVIHQNRILEVSWVSLYIELFIGCFLVSRLSSYFFNWCCRRLYIYNRRQTIETNYCFHSNLICHK